MANLEIGHRRNHSFPSYQLDENLISVRLHRPAVQKFKQETSYTFIKDIDLSELQVEIAPLVHSDEDDVDALRFDALMYGFICSCAME